MFRTKNKKAINNYNTWRRLFLKKLGYKNKDVEEDIENHIFLKDGVYIRVHNISLVEYDECSIELKGKYLESHFTIFEPNCEKNK